MANTNEPNQFTFSGDNLKVVYTTHGIQGIPLLSVTTKKGTTNFSGNQIGVLDTPFGKLVTVTTEFVPDLKDVTLSVAVPRINLPPGTVKQTFRTFGVFTTTRTSIGGPGLVQGVVQTYKEVALRGTAKLVETLTATQSG